MVSRRGRKTPCWKFRLDVIGKLVVCVFSAAVCGCLHQEDIAVMADWSRSRSRSPWKQRQNDVLIYASGSREELCVDELKRLHCVDSRVAVVRFAPQQVQRVPNGMLCDWVSTMIVSAVTSGFIGRIKQNMSMHWGRCTRHLRTVDACLWNPHIVITSMD